MNGVIYARYSSTNQREESIEGQLRECREYADKNGITVIGTYIDRACSARTDKRPDFQKMIKDSAKKKFDVVIVWKLDRFARKRYDSANYKFQLKRNNVKVLSATEIITPTPEGVMVEAMLEGIAEAYSLDLSEKVIRGRTENAIKCKSNGGTIPIGYIIENHYFKIDPVTAPVVLEAFNMYADGVNMQRIADEMNAKGVHTTRGGHISVNVVTRMLSNRRYIGEYSYRSIFHENGIPAIVPRELFERVATRIEQTKKAPARCKAEDKYILTTKLFCGKCQSMMTGESGTSHTSQVHHYYKCFGVRKHICDKKTVKKEWIEEIVIEQIKLLIFNDELLEKLADTVINLLQQENTALPNLKRTYAEVQRGIDNMLNAIQSGIITESTKERLDDLEARKKELSIQIAQEEIAKPVLTREQILFWLQRFRKYDTNKTEHRMHLIDSFINAIFLYDDKIVITFNYRNGTKTISLSDIENSALGSDLTMSAAPTAQMPYVSKRI